MKNINKIILLVLVVLLLCSCEPMGSREYGVRFWKLPPVIGGGVSSRIFQPGEMVVVLPVISKVYKFDTGVKDVSWGGIGIGTDPNRADYVQTRAFDGNEVALAVTVSYKIKAGAGIVKMVQEVATSDEEVEALVVGVARADIRTFMNEIKTSEFISKEPRYEAVDKVKASMRKRLAPYGIEIVRVNLDDFKFRRLKSDGSFDDSYEERLKEIQEKREETERERARIATVVAKKEQEVNDMQAQVNQVVEESKGFKAQAQARGDAYLQAKQNDAEAILAKGQAEVEGLLEQISALSGPGGKEILKLELARQLLKNNPKFVLMESGAQSDGIEVKKVDTNDLIRQLGVLEGMAPNDRGTGDRVSKGGAVAGASKKVAPAPAAN
ncbi:SPFH domain-containing protein [Oligoflexia bacterium]|nr:SPFH domain-containing protein [Oligoflexia bacterium]